MTCQRCHGFMYDGFLAEPDGIYVVKKCANCGEMLDEVILANRTRPAAMVVRKRALWRKTHLKVISGSRRH